MIVTRTQMMTKLRIFAPVCWYLHDFPMFWLIHCEATVAQTDRREINKT